MDPSIMKLLEDDEDESMHSGADVEAFTAALSRDIGGVGSGDDADVPAVSLPSASAAVEGLSKGSSSTLPGQSQTSDRDKDLNKQIKEKDTKHLPSGEQNVAFQLQQKPCSIQPCGPEIVSHERVDQNQDKLSAQDPVCPMQDGAHHSEGMQQLSSQQTTNAASQISNSMQQRKPTIAVPIQMLLPLLRTNLDKDKAMQFDAVYNKLKDNKISADDFVRFIRDIVGNHMLERAVNQLQMQASKLHGQAGRDSQMKLSQHSVQNQGSSQIHTSVTAQQLIGPRPIRHLPLMSSQDQKNEKSAPDQHHFSASQAQKDANFTTPGKSIEKPQQTVCKSVVKEEQFVQEFSARSIEKPQQTVCKSQLISKQQQQTQLPQSLPMLGNSFSSVSAVNTVASKSLNSQNKGSQPRQASIGHDMFLTKRGIPQTLKMPSQISSGTPATSTATAVNIPSKKPSFEQKRPLEALDTTSSQPSKKQKTAGASADQSIELLNDVTAVSGVNLREEEEQLFAVPQEEGRDSEAIRRVVQEEEERSILQKGILQKKLAAITSRCGIASVANDVERCLSVCVEERLLGLLTNLIRLSKQRVDVEKSRHQFVVTSDVRRQILMVNQKAREDWEKKQAEKAEKLRKLDEDEGNTGPDSDKNKDDTHSKTSKANKEIDDKMRATAANVAARAAVGGDDMLSKWQLMAEQARQRRERGFHGASVNNNPSTDSFDRTQKAEKGGLFVDSQAGGIRKSGKNPATMAHPKISRNITTKDVMAVLEREPQMSRSNLIYHLFERAQSSYTAE